MCIDEIAIQDFERASDGADGETGSCECDGLGLFDDGEMGLYGSRGRGRCHYI